MLNRTFSFSCMIFVLLSCTTLREIKSVESSSDEYLWIDGVVDSTMIENNIPALSIGIVKTGELVYAKGFGVTDREKKDEVTENTIYQIGSDTKKMTSIIVKKLEDEGIIRMDESVALLLKEKISDSSAIKLENISMEHLLRHKAGVAYRAPSNKRIDGEPMVKEYSEADLLHDLNNLKLNSAPGDEFGYSNFGYAIAGYVCELATGMSYAKLVKEYISIPYSMNNTSVFLSEKQKALLATPYRKDDRKAETSPWKMGKLAPAGGVYSNIVDQSKLMIQQVRAYRNYKQSGNVSSSLFLTMDDREEGGHYGLGLGKTVDQDNVRYGHGGDLDGYASSYVFSPDKNMGLIILTSSGGKWLGKMEKAMQKKLFK